MAKRTFTTTIYPLTIYAYTQYWLEYGGVYYDWFIEAPTTVRLPYTNSTNAAGDTVSISGYSVVWQAGDPTDPPSLTPALPDPTTASITIDESYDRKAFIVSYGDAAAAATVVPIESGNQFIGYQALVPIMEYSGALAYSVTNSEGTQHQFTTYSRITPQNWPGRLRVAPITFSHYEYNWGDGTIETSADATRSHTFEARSGVSTGVVIKGFDGFGRRIFTDTRKLRPKANFTYTVDGTTVHFDAANSFDIDGSIVEYYWYFYGTIYNATLNSGATPTASYTYPSDGEYTVKLRVKDNDGIYDEITITVVVDNPYLFGSMVDATTGVLFTALNEGDNVQVYRFPSGTASREALATITDAKNASLTRGSDAVITLGYTQRSSGDCVTATSDDDGRSFA